MTEIKDKETPETEIKTEEDEKSGDTFNLLMYNVKLFPPNELFNLKDAQETRAELIPKAIISSLKDIDVIALAELWIDNNENSHYKKILVEGLEKVGYKHYCNQPTVPNNWKSDNIVQNSIATIQGSVIIFTKHKILKETSIHYDINEVSPDYNIFGVKGVSHVKIEKNKIVYHIFATHLQGGNNDERLNKKHKQIEHLRKVIQKEIETIPITKNEVIILTGDFNSDRQRDPKTFDLIEGKNDENNPLRFKELITNKELSFDGGNNTTNTDFNKPFDSGGRDKTIKLDENKKFYFLDHIFYEINHKIPKKSEQIVTKISDENGYQIRIITGKDITTLPNYSDNKVTFHDLSDHHSLHGKFTF